MRPDTEEMLKALENELFVSDEYASVRNVLYTAPTNSDVPEDIDVVFDRIETYTPGMKMFVNSLLQLPTDFEMCDER